MPVYGRTGVSEKVKVHYSPEQARATDGKWTSGGADFSKNRGTVQTAQGTSSIIGSSMVRLKGETNGHFRDRVAGTIKNMRALKVKLPKVRFARTDSVKAYERNKWGKQSNTGIGHRPPGTARE